MRLKEIRKKRKMTVPELSKISGVPVRTIEDIQRKGECKVRTAIKLADALEVTLDELCRHYEESFMGFDNNFYKIYEGSIEEDGTIHARVWDCKKGKYFYPKTEAEKQIILERAKTLSSVIIID